MHNSRVQVRQRQQAALNVAAEQRDAQRLRKLGRATRRAERAERQLSRSWGEVAQRREELAKLAADPRG
jgi:hypothetical protein